MVSADPVADLLVSLKNAGAVGHRSVTTPFSNLRLAVAEALRRAGFVKNIVKKGKKVKKYLELELIYAPDGRARLQTVKKVSRSSRRVYRGFPVIYPVRQGSGVAIYSTPRGVLTGEEAKKERVGGELLAEVW